jgi:hypothetical protein
MVGKYVKMMTKFGELEQDPEEERNMTSATRKRVDILKARVREGCDCGCNEPVATEPIEMLKFLARRFESAGVGEAVAEIYAHDIRKILASLGENDD